MNYLNISNNMSPEQIFLEVHKSAVIPGLYIIFAIVLLVFLMVGLLYLKRKEAKLNYFYIWLIASFFSALFLIWLVTTPTAILHI